VKMKSDYLWRRGGQWWLRVAIPRHLRHRFPAGASGKHPTMVAEPLGDSASAAKVAAARRAAECLELFADLKAGRPVAPERIAAVLRGHRQG
jgi:hypothetical protein